jgi:dimethylsulfone monooxygenase
MGTTLETITWATGLLASTKRLIAFGTVHAPLFHPIIAAKQFVTADQVGRGRFGLNIVVGWNEDEFQMFGVTQREHEQRYEYAQEWIDAVKMAWGPGDDLAFDGRYIKLKKVRAKPKPYGGSRPLIMNAGASPTGRAFAIRNCDAFFTQASRTSMAETAKTVKAAKDEAAAQGRELDVYAVGVVTCRPTQKEAEEYYHYATIEKVGWSAVDGILGKKNISPATVGDEEFQRQRHHYAHGLGGLLMVGDPDQIAQQLADLSRAGLRGIGFSFVNYLKELPYFCDEVLPRLERLGVREKRSA